MAFYDNCDYWGDYGCGYHDGYHDGHRDGENGKPNRLRQNKSYRFSVVFNPGYNDSGHSDSSGSDSSDESTHGCNRKPSCAANSVSSSEDDDCCWGCGTPGCNGGCICYICYEIGGCSCIHDILMWQTPPPLNPATQSSKKLERCMKRDKCKHKGKGTKTSPHSQEKCRCGKCKKNNKNSKHSRKPNGKHRRPKNSGKNGLV